ncbi:MAG: glycine cleavage system protein GcvH [bacterium]
MSIPEDLLYTSEHIWLKVEGDRIKIGLTKHAQSDMGEILLVELPDTGKQIKAGERFAVIETAKAISDLKSPISGLIIDVNKDLEKKPDLINKEPYERGWLILIRKDPSEDLNRLMDFKAYESFLR